LVLKEVAQKFADAAEAESDKVCPPNEQIELIERHGLVVDAIATVPVSALRERPISHKLQILSSPDTAVVTGYAVSSPALLS